MPPRPGSKQVYFPKVREAREALASKALDLFETYQTLIRDAIAAQEFEVASKGLQYLMDHMPKDGDGTTMLDPSIDRKVKVGKDGPKGPTIQIGIALGGMDQRRELPPHVIDVEAEDEN